MGEPTFIDTPKGDQLVILTRAEYDALLARLEEIEEDAMDAAIGIARLAEWETAGRPAYPLAVARLIREGETPLLAFRHIRKLSRHDLAAKSGVDPAYLEQWETGRTTAPAGVLAALAKALDTTEASLRAFVDATGAV